jgi:hypothetical protein
MPLSRLSAFLQKFRNHLLSKAGSRGLDVLPVQKRAFKRMQVCELQQLTCVFEMETVRPSTTAKGFEARGRAFCQSREPCLAKAPRTLRNRL